MQTIIQEIKILPNDKKIIIEKIGVFENIRTTLHPDFLDYENNDALFSILSSYLPGSSGS